MKLLRYVVEFTVMEHCGLFQHEDNKEKKQESQKFHFDAM